MRYAFPDEEPEFDDLVTAASSRALDRHANSIPYFDTRWLWGIVIVAPIMFSAGIYWLHRMATAPQAGAGLPMVEVRLITQLPDSTPLMPARNAVSEGRRDPMIDAPNKPIPEEVKAAARPAEPIAPEPVPPEPSPSKAPTMPAARPSAASGISTPVFQRVLLSHIARFRQYPPAAKSGQHGITQLVFAMRRDGTVSEVWIRSSSGSRLLDDAAMDTIRRAQPLPRIPADLPDQLTILVPISFDPP